MMIFAFMGVVLINLGSSMAVSIQYPHLGYGLVNGFLWASFMAMTYLFIKKLNSMLHFIYSAFSSGIAGIWIIAYCLIT